ncbi:zinc ribbon domain-containing protein [Streptomyces europaeiscabiei]|uniref:zinc ribbon domain-containing protein n=1 Tax=Streptomyces europaeiscabiei TaxID=146819 RepID=UPI003990A5F8
MAGAGQHTARDALISLGWVCPGPFERPGGGAPTRLPQGYRDSFAVLGIVPRHAGIQGGTVRPNPGQDRPVRTDLSDLLRLWRQGRAQTLNVRERTCTACGTVHDRDANAAINVKTAAGLAVSACGAPVGPGAMPAQREEAGSHGFPAGCCAT